MEDVSFEKLMVAQLLNKHPIFTEPESLISRSQNPFIYPILSDTNPPVSPQSL